MASRKKLQHVVYIYECTGWPAHWGLGRHTSFIHCTPPPWWHTMLSQPLSYEETITLLCVYSTWASHYHMCHVVQHQSQAAVTHLSGLSLNLAFKKMLIRRIQFFLLSLFLYFPNVHTVYIVCIHNLYHSAYPQDNIRDFISSYSQLNVNVYHINWLQWCINCAVLDALHQLNSYNIHFTLTVAISNHNCLPRRHCF